MKNDNDMDLIRLFEDVDEPAEDEIFIGRVAKRITLLRYSRRIKRILLALAGMAVLVLLKPWLMDLTRSIAIASDLLTGSIVSAIISPAGCIIGGGVVLPFFLKTIIERS